MAKKQLPNSKVKALLLSKTDIKRVAGEAVPQAGDVAAEIVAEIGRAAAGIARTFGRKTIMAEDLKQACKVGWGGPSCDALTSTGKLKRKRKTKGDIEPSVRYGEYHENTGCRTDYCSHSVPGDGAPTGARRQPGPDPDAAAGAGTDSGSCAYD